jgi:hypothetical protein
MVINQPNFISDSELKQFVEDLEFLTSQDVIEDDVFYKWYLLDHTKLETYHPYYSLVLERMKNKIRRVTGLKGIDINYFGFAYQTKGFPYHADNEWPIESRNRNLGDPTRDELYTNYEGEWIPNYASSRRFTTVLYLNDNFDGGETHFPIQDVKLKPESKKLAGFYCDRDYVHGVLPTTNGVRKALIVWFD